MIKFFSFKTIRGRMVFWLIASIVIMLLVKSSVTLWSQIDESNKRIKREMTLYLTLGDSALQTALWDMNKDNMQDVLEMLLKEPVVAEAEILDNDGKRLLKKKKAGFEVRYKNLIMDEKEIRHEGQLIGSIKLTLIREFYQETLIKNLLTDLFFSLVTILVAGIVIGWVAHRITKPIGELVSTADKVSNGDLEAKFLIESIDEVGRLSQALESMTSQIRAHILALEQDRSEISALYEETSAMNEELSHMLDLVNKNYEETLQTLANAIEANDHYTKGHCERVRDYALILGAAIGLDTLQMQCLSRAALLHDIGKIGVPSDILNKETPLTDVEIKSIQQHCIIGSQILSQVMFLEASVPIICQHHERVDGSGYPEGLIGENIHPLARILAIADAYDAMTTSRAYRKIPLSQESAITELERGSGKQFDAAMVCSFKACFHKDGAFL